MKKFIALSLCLASFSVFARDLGLHCELSKNGSVGMVKDFVLKAGQRNLAVGAVDEFNLIVSSDKNDKVEVQVYNEDGPERSYATGEIKSKSSVVELAHWTRDFLLEAKCMAN
jgi:hypothetical protein